MSDIDEVLARNGLDLIHTDCTRQVIRRRPPWSKEPIATEDAQDARVVLETVARLLDALDAEMAPSIGDEWSDLGCNTNFHDARAILAEVLR